MIRRITIDPNEDSRRRITIDPNEDNSLFAVSESSQHSDEDDDDPQEVQQFLTQLTQEDDRVVDYDEIIRNMKLPPEADLAVEDQGTAQGQLDDFAAQDDLDDFDLAAVRAAAEAEKQFQMQEEAAEAFQAQEAATGGRVDAQFARSASTDHHLRPASKRARTAGKQTKITDLFRQPSNNVSSSTQAVWKDTDDQIIASGRLFKKGEVWFSRGCEELEGYYFGLHNGFIMKGRWKSAMCRDHVYIDFSKTFIGPEQAARLAAAWQNTPQNPRFAKCVNTTNILEDDCIRLTVLTERCKERFVEPALMWSTKEKGTFGVGYNKAYYYALDTTQRLHPPRREKGPVAMDVFAGCGGMSIAMANEGFDVKYKVEHNAAAVATLQFNFPDSMVFQEDVRIFLKNCKEKRLACYPQPGQIDHCHWSTPCRGVSEANRNGGVNDAANNALIFCVRDDVEYLQPITGSFENVLGLMKNENKRKYLQKLVTELLILSYQVRVCIVSSADYGDPQHRDRVIMFIARRGFPLPEAPEVTHGPGKSKPHVTVKEALFNLEDIDPRPGSGLVEVAKDKVKQLVWNHNEEMTSLRDKPDNMDKIVADEPAGTLRRRNAVQHYSKRRCLTSRERARLQSFPDSYRFFGTPGEQCDQIGNAVPVNLGEAIMKSVAKCYKQMNAWK